MPGTRGRASGEANAIADDAIRALGPLATRARIVAEITRRCDAVGTQRPSDASVTARIARQRHLADHEPGRGMRLVIDQVRVAPSGGVSVPPLLTFAILDPLRAIVGHSVEEDGAAAAAAARLLARLGRDRRGGKGVTVRTPALTKGGWLRLRADLVAAGLLLAPPVAGSARLGREADLLVGGWLAGARSGRERTRRLAGVTLDDATATIDEAVRAHNAVHGRNVPRFALIGPTRREAFEAWSAGLDDHRLV